VSIFDARSDGNVPRYGPIFKALDKITFAAFDKQKDPLSTNAQTQLDSYDKYWESPESGIKRLLATQTPLAVLRRFLDAVVTRLDYPTANDTKYSSTTPDEDLPDIAFAVLKARKGDAWGYAAMLVEHCATDAELPEFLRTVLLKINEFLSEAPEEIPSEDAEAGDATDAASEGGE